MAREGSAGLSVSLHTREVRVTFRLGLNTLRGRIEHETLDIQRTSLSINFANLCLYLHPAAKLF